MQKEDWIIGFEQQHCHEMFAVPTDDEEPDDNIALCYG